MGLALALAGCGASGSAPRPATAPASLVRGARPIGRAPRFHPPAGGRVLGPCHSPLGPRAGVHVELFAADRVVLVAEGIGVRSPRRDPAGRISSARCYGALVTLDPTGVVLVRPGTHPTVADLFRAWGQPLGARRMGSFSGTVTAYVGGWRWTAGAPGAIPLTRHAEIVLEVGPHVPPHHAYRFPPGT